MNRRIPNPLQCFKPLSRVLSLGAAGLVAATLIGCSRSPAPDSDVTADTAVIEPSDPQPSTAPPAATAEDGSAGQPPGTLELPSDFEPGNAAPSDAAGARSGGLEMPATTDGVQAPAPSAGPEAANSTEVSLRAAQWDEISQRLTSTGQITVVDVWSLACEPCLKEFPGLVAIDREFGDRVACFSVNVDFDGRKTKPAESYRPRVEAFLRSVEATFPNFLSETASDDLFAALGINSIPAVLIYDADGKLVRTFSDVGADAGFTYAENILPFVTQLLAQNS